MYTGEGQRSSCDWPSCLFLYVHRGTQEPKQGHSSRDLRCSGLHRSYLHFLNLSDCVHVHKVSRQFLCQYRPIKEACWRIYMYNFGYAGFQVNYPVENYKLNTKILFALFHLSCISVRELHEVLGTRNVKTNIFPFIVFFWVI